MNERTEAERLRVILQAFAFANPSMSMDEALPLILETEKRTVTLEGPKVVETERVFFVLKDNHYTTVADFIDKMPAIISLIDDGKTINAIKEVRSCVRDATDPATFLGLRESKEGVEHWKQTRRGIGGMPSHRFTYPSKPATAPSDIAAWIYGQAMIKTMLANHKAWVDAGHPSGDPRSSMKIHAIKEIRAGHGVAGLKEAKEGAEYFMDHYL